MSLKSMIIGESETRQVLQQRRVRRDNFELVPEEELGHLNLL